MRRRSVLLTLAAGVAIGVVLTLLLQRQPIAPAAPGASARPVLYWYDPMVPNQHFDKPGKSPFMDMQLVPRYADDAAADGIVQIDPRQVQNLGMRSVPAVRGALVDALRVTGTVAFDQRAVRVVQSRVGAIVGERLVRAPLTPVRRGQPLMTLISREWVAAQDEYLAAKRVRETRDIVHEAGRRRLVSYGMTDDEIAGIERSGKALQQIVVSAPRDGVIGEFNATEGSAVSLGGPLLRLYGLDTVWLNLAIAEGQVARVRAGAPVTVEFAAFPGETTEGSIETLLADVDPVTRTQTARVVLPNPGHKLVPGMVALVRIQAAATAEQWLVPSEAVITTGTRQVVMIDLGQGRYRAQQVRTGAEAGGRSVVLEGLGEGDAVVVSGQFLLDSEASLRGTLARLDSTAGATRYDATGTVEAIDGNRWRIHTDAIAAMKMGAMAMDYVIAPQVDVRAIRVGQRVAFRFSRNARDEFEIDTLTSAATPATSPPPHGDTP